MPNKGEQTRAHIFLCGRVQGVGLRFYIQSLANRQALHGFVRNLPDGRVESVLEGPGRQVEKVLEEIKKGEYANYIRDVQCVRENATNAFTGFEIVP